MSEAEADSDDVELRELLDAIYSRFHYDFRSYSLASVRRRVAQARAQLGFDSTSALSAALAAEPGLFSKLLQFLTVQVSDMFRDPSFFRAMREQVVPVLETYPSIKIWVAGCSTGEEVYSLAILLDEAGLLDRSLIYATDINPDALRRAEAAVFSLDRMAAFTENHRASGATRSLSEYYTAAYGSAVFDRALKRKMVFSDHSLATDSVFAEVHLISCRNVLIYFDRALQDRALALMRDSLVRRGFLGLGSKESLQFSAHEAEFEPLVKGEPWYRRLT